MTAGRSITATLTLVAVALIGCAGSPEAEVSAVTAPPDVGPANTWSPLTVMAVVDPLDLGAVGDGQADDTAAVTAAIDAIGDGGGIVWLEPGTSYRTSNVIPITGDHVKIWTPNGGAEIFAETGGRDRVQALMIDGAHGVGLFGLRTSSDVDRRQTALEDSAIVIDGGFETEIVGLDISGSSSAAVMVFGNSTRTMIDGNYLHDNWADGIHFTDGADGAWVWNNIFASSAPAKGDDGIACVTYGSGPKCGNMEWWDNLYLGGEWGRGLAVVGGHDIAIHDNVICRSAAAGILVASEPSYETSGSERIRIVDNVIVGAGGVVPHAGILISGMNGELNDITVMSNVVADSVTGQAFRVEGDVTDIDHTGTTTRRPDDNVCPARSEANPSPKDTSIMATRDTSFVDRDHRRGLHRVLVRTTTEKHGFEQQFEYVAVHRRSDLDGLRFGADVMVERYDGNSETGDGDATPESPGYLVIRSAQPLILPEALDAVTFEDLRELAETQPVLWAKLEAR